MSRIIKIEDIENAPSKKLQITFEENIEELNFKKPLKAELEITSLGEFIEVKGDVTGSVLLECDLCLSEFEYELYFEIDELFAKNSLLEEYGPETELKDGQFVTDLQGSNNINLYDLLYQSVILDFPNKKVCGINCKGDKFLTEKEFLEKTPDPRLAVFKDIQIGK